MVNWVDFLMFLLMAAGISAGIHKGLMVEFLNIISLFCATFIAAHYYPQFAIYLMGVLPKSFGYFDLLGFGLLALITLLIFYFIREGWLIILKLELPEKFDRWAGGILATVKGVLIGGLVFVCLMLTGNNVIRQTAHNAISSVIFENVTFEVYESVFSRIHKYFPKEKLNLKLRERLPYRMVEKQ